ncbi:MAG: DUF2304 domain-containing protein [Acidobacteria bacterium]|nr:DUF2304 domain-containing protein [Acidobacteriota bacterium]
MNPYPISAIQIVSIVFSILLLISVFFLIRRKKIREEYAILWVGIFFLFFILSVFRGVIDVISNLLDIKYQPASLFLILFGCLFLLTFHFSLVVSKLKKNMNALAKTITILEERLRETKPETGDDGEKGDA